MLNLNKQRDLKITGATVSMSQNGNSVNAPVFDRQTLYASPLITITDKGYTKHYFEEGNRICSSIGGGRLGLVDEAEPIVTPWDECKTALRQGVLDTYRQNFAVEPHTDDIVDLYETVEYWSGKDTDEPTFYYHTDHLGSATLITDDAADVVQQIAYMPYGEDWIDVRSSGYFGSAYKFNGKEKDDETGYSYYGARYYTDRLSIWLSVDPLADKYPHLSPYAYCADNPVIFRDPDGRDFDPRSEKIAQEKESHIRNRMSSIDIQITQNEENGVDNTQLNARKEELGKSLKDIDDMRNDHTKLYEFKTGKIDVTTQKTNKKGKTVVTMMTTQYEDRFDDNMANSLHEMRHGGQIARGESTGFDAKGNPSTESTYNLDMEVSAYRAQFAWSGKLGYNPVLLKSGQKWPSRIILNIFDINRSLIKNMYEIMGNGKPIYLYYNLP